jgi:GntR family transcriptional repressor for pyruvate dehydrogenase complex
MGVSAESTSHEARPASRLQPRPPSELRPVERHRLYEQVLAQLRAHVEKEGLRAGDRLPSERELAERLGVSRNSIKQATTVLEVQGLVETRHGGGTYLRTASLMVEPIAVLVDLKQRLPDIIEARVALEPELARLAAVRRTDDDLGAMAAALDEMAGQVAAGQRGEEGDRKFHSAMAEASHSRILVEFYRQLSPKIAETRRESLKQAHRPARSLAEHQTIHVAVLDGDQRRAATAVRRHLMSVSRVRLLGWDPDS